MLLRNSQEEMNGRSGVAGGYDGSGGVGSDWVAGVYDQ